MGRKYFLFVLVFLLFHLQVFAGETIHISNIKSLKPVVSVQLTHTVSMQLQQQGMRAAPALLAIYLVVNDTPSAIPVAGQYLLKGNSLSFTPYYTLGYNLQFEARYENGTGFASWKRFTTPPNKSSEKTATVITAYPLSDTIPYNTLFFHVRFSQAMMQDEHAYKYVKMYDEEGAERENAWRQKSFWLDDGKLLVLMIHPGRVKNGIHYESPLFDLGKRYTIKVSKGIRDVNENPIAQEYTQGYYISAEDRESPAVFFDKIKLPHRGTNSPIILTFSEGMDNASVVTGISITDASGKDVPVTISANGNDRQYKITPAQAWNTGQYTLLLQSAVYDFSANRINRLFEIKDASEMEKDKIEMSHVFTIQ